jgi:hypothetical protein
MVLGDEDKGGGRTMVHGAREGSESGVGRPPASP